MAGSPRITIKKYFGNASIEQMELSLAEAKGYLDYFWTKDGSSNVVVSVGGQQLHSYEELTALVNQERYKNKSFVEVGLFLSNDGHKSIWPQQQST
jgi:hypothetical protein